MVNPAIKPLFDRSVIIDKLRVGILVIDGSEKLITLETKIFAEIAEVTKYTILVLVAFEHLFPGNRISDHCKGQLPVVMLDFPESVFSKKVLQ